MKKTFAEWLKETLKTRRIKRNDLAKKLNMDRTTLYRKLMADSFYDNEKKRIEKLLSK